MLDEKELEKLGIQNWSKLRKKFEGSNLLLGNGFSLNIASSFHYKSLFDKFLDKCPPEYADKFRKFGTHNFEIILEKLIIAKDVNQIFGNDRYQIREAINLLKSGLITTIQEIHPRAEKVYRGMLERIAPQIRFFNAVFTLNYDLFLYHIVMIIKDQGEKANNLLRYSDCFWEGYDGDFHRFNPHQDYNQFRFVYYLHGALFLFRESWIDLKLLRKLNDRTELVERVGQVIEKGKMPLFVCEGTSEEKKETIDLSDYLSFALDKLKESRENLVIFGTSLSKQDQHIISAIDYNRKTLAISIHVKNKSLEELEKEINETRNKFNRSETFFFNSETLFDFSDASVPDKGKLEVTTETSPLDSVRKCWPEIVKSMKGEGKHGNLDAIIRSTSEPIGFDAGVLTIGFYHKFHLEYMQERDYQEVFERKISEILKTPVRLQYTLINRPVHDK